MSCPRLFEPVDAAHLETCSECRALQGAFASGSAAAVSLDALKGAALAELERAPKTRPWWHLALGFVALTAAVAALATALMSASTVQHASATLRQASAAGWVATMLVAAFSAVMPGARGLRRGVLASVLGCFALTLVAASGHDPGMGGVGCAITEWAVALLPLGLGLFVITGFAFDAQRALAAGIAAVSAGMLSVHLHCPNGTLAHQALFHLAPILGLALLTLVVRRVLPSRSHVP